LIDRPYKASTSLVRHQTKRTAFINGYACRQQGMCLSWAAIVCKSSNHRVKRHRICANIVRSVGKPCWEFGLDTRVLAYQVKSAVYQGSGVALVIL
jgi:hypothetical protein